MTRKSIMLAAAGVLMLAACGMAAQKADNHPIAAIGVMQPIPNGVAKAFAAPVRDVRTAVLKSLLHMEVRVVFDSEADQGWQIWAVANERLMLIQLQRVSPTTTLMRVVVDHSGWDEEGQDIAARTTAPRAGGSLRGA